MMSLETTSTDLISIGLPLQLHLVHTHGAYMLLQRLVTACAAIAAAAASPT